MEAAVSAILLLAVPSFSQTPDGWPFAGNDLNNSRWASAETILNNQNVSGLTVKWQFTTQNDVSATPSVDATGGYVYFPDWSGNLYKLNAATGATVWTHKMTDYGLSSGVMSRTTPTLYGTMVIIGASASLATQGPYGSYLLGLNASDGSLLWITALDPDLNSLATASPIIYNGIAYEGVSSTEEKLTNPAFRGSLVAVSLANGQILWKTYFVPSSYTGAPVWSSTPVVDITRSQIYVTTGNNYLVPSSVQACEQAANGNLKAVLACQASNNYEDSIVALDLTTGNVKWGLRCSADDAWITACTQHASVCPDPSGQDFDFGSGANLFTATINGVPTQMVGAGQKSGVYWAVSPASGATLWSTTVGPSGLVGGIQWGTASDNQRIYVAISNAAQKPYTLQPSGVSWNGGSWAALNPATGAILWQVPDPGFSTVHPSNHAMALGPVTVANGVVYAASMSGYLYALDAATGATLWSFQAPGSVNAAPAVVNGTLYWGTGYHNFPAGAPLGTASNTFYSFSLPASNQPAPVTLACAANGGQVGAPYSSALAAAGGVPPYTFSITGGSLPPGLTLNGSTGAISGTPTTPGSFSYTIQVADSTGTPAGTATSTCGINIAPAPVTLACAANAGQVGATYSSSLTAAGGEPPYTFSFTVGSLPPGLTLNGSTGAINGTPATAGSFTFTAQVVDSTGTPAGTATGNCGIAIAAEQTSTTLSVASNPALLGQPVTLTAQISPAPGAGKVTFYDGVAVLGSVTVAGGSASLTTSLLTAAAHTLRAQYDGNPTYVGSASAAVALTVTALPSSTLLPATPYLANGPGTWVAVGDFNGDGKADFVVADSGVSVWLGNGDGTFQAPVNSAVGASPVALATADFNEDGRLDVAAVYASGGVAILLGNGDGTFQSAVNYAAGSSPSGAAVADFNGDGAADLAVANAGGVSVLLGNGDGTFQAAVNYAAGSGPAAVAAGDFIGNGKADLAVVNAADGTVSVLLGNGDGTFQAAVTYPVGTNPQAVALGDLNGDGRPDLVVANNAANSVSVLLGNGDGTFQAAVSYAAGANPQSVAVEDLNGDGKADVVAASTGSGSVSVLLGNGDGTLQAVVAFGAGSGPVSLALADFNGNSWAGVVTTGGGGNTAEVLLGGQAATSVTLSSSQNPTTAGQSVTLTGSVTPVAPFFGLPAGTLTFSDNGTALPSGTVGLSGGAAAYTTSSLAVGAHPIASAYSGNAAFLAGTSGTLTETVNQAAQSIAFGSIPNQTYGSAPFPVAATASSGLAVCYTAAGQCTVSGNTVTLTGAGSCTITANQPGNATYAAAPPVSQSFAIAPAGTSTTLSVMPSPALLGQPVTLTAQISPAPGTGKVTFYDGVAVLGSVTVAGGSASLTTSQSTAAAHTLRASYGGSPSFTGSASTPTALTVTALPSSTLLPATPYLANGPGTWVAVGDFNGDGKADFVVADSGVSVWLGNGDGTFQAPVNSAVGASPVALATADFNEDGLLDVAAVYASGGVAILLGNGDGTFQSAVNYAAGSVPSGVAVADFNGDGAPDLAVANAGGVSMLLGNGDGTFQAAVNYTAGSGPAAVAAGDFIGNGKADLAVVNAADGTVSVLLGNGDGTFQPAVSYPVGTNPQAVALGDLNGDGRPDLVVANNSANSVSVLLGNGDGTFQAAVSYAAGANPQSVAVEDMNGDGKADVVAADAGSGSVSVLLGNGDGTLQAAVAFGAGSGPVSLALADFNGNSWAGVVATGGSGNTAQVLLGGQAATSVALSSSQNPSSLGQSVTLTGSVTPVAPFFGLPAGTLTFSDNGTALPSGTVGLSGSAAAYTTASLAVGSHPITSAYSGNAAFQAGTSAVLTETVNQAAQTITFGSIPNQTFGSAPFPVGATASSGLTVSFASTTPAVCTVSGATVTLAAVGACTIQATQAGNANWAAATPVNQSFQIAQGSQAITFGALSNRAFGGAPFAVSATASSGLAVSFASTTPGYCTVSNATVTLVAAGTCTIKAAQAGNANWAVATPVNQSFQITQGSQTITFGTLSNRAFGTAPFAVSATASSGLAVTFGSTTPAVCTVSGTTVTLAAVGTCTIKAAQAGNANWAAATPVNQSFQVTHGSQTITFAVLSNRAFGTAPFTVAATASSGLAVSFASTTQATCTVSSATVTLVAAGTCTIQATQAGNANWAAATPVNQSFQVTQESQTITFGALPNLTFGTVPFTVSATASSGLAVSFGSTTPGVCTVSGATVTLAAVGACTIRTAQAGNANWAAATPVNQSFQVTQRSQTITFGALSNRTLGAAPFKVDATASSGLAVSFASTTAAVCTVSGSTVTLVAVGTCTIQATQAGNANWAAATPVSQSFQVK
jgi:outer membrane protein assembly factor BamB